MEVNPWTFLKKYQFPLLLLGIGFFVFGNSLFGQPIWDDTAYIFDNPDFKSIHFINIFTNNIYVLNGYYRPLTAFYYSIMIFLFGQQTFFFHMIQLIIHIVNTLLLFFILKKFLQKQIAFLSSLIFLIHPLLVEAVVYIAAADDVGSFFCGISALYLVIHSKLSKKTYVAIFFLFLSGLLIKESAIVFLILSAFYVFLLRKDKLRNVLIPIISSIAAYIFLRIDFVGLSHQSTPITPIAAVHLPQRLLSIPAIFFYYLSNVFFPWKLAIDQQWIVTSPTIYDFYFLLLFLLMFVAFLVLFSLRIRTKNLQYMYMFFLCWFLIGIGIHLQLIPLDMTVADRWFYIPFAGFLGVVGVGMQYCLKNKKILYIGMSIIICFLAIRTMIRNTNWVDRVTLYSHDADITQSYELEANLTDELIDAKKYDEAFIHAKKSIDLMPLDYNTYNLGALYEIEKNISLAKKYYYQSLVSRSNPLPGHIHILAIYQGVGEFAAFYDSPQTSVHVLTTAIKDYPYDATLWMYLAVAEYKAGDQKSAEMASAKAVLLSPTENSLYVKQQIFQHAPLFIVNKLGASQIIGGTKKTE